MNRRGNAEGQAQEGQQSEEGEQTTPENGSLAIVAEELEDGANRLPEACYIVEIPPGGQSFGPFCDEDGDGEVTVQGVTPGPVAVVESTPPPDTEPAQPARQEVDIVAGEEAKVVFHHSPAAQEQETGTLVILVENEDDERVGGACFTITGETDTEPLTDVCDQGDDGSLTFPDLPSGNYTIVQTRAGENRQLAPEQTVTVEPGKTVEVTLLNSREPELETPTATPRPEQTPTSTPAPELEPIAAPPSTPEEETGTVELVASDDDGNPIEGQCYTLVGVTGSFGPFCDNGEGDSSVDPGVLTVEGLPVGTYEAVLETDVADADVEQAQQAKQRRSVSVRRGGRPTRAIFNIRAQQRQRGDLLIRVRDQDGSYLTGACFGLIPDGETAPSAEVCDNRGDDENSADGRILLTGIRAGRYTLTQTTAPSGYSTAADQSVRIAAGSVREVAVTNQPEPEQTATLDVETTDSRGDRAARGLLRDHAREFDPRSLRRQRRRNHPLCRYTTRQLRRAPDPAACGGLHHGGLHSNAPRPRPVCDGDRRQRGAAGQPGAAQDRRCGSASGGSLLRAPQWRPRRLLDLRQRCQRRQHQRRRHLAGDGRRRELTPYARPNRRLAIWPPPTRK